VPHWAALAVLREAARIGAAMAVHAKAALRNVMDWFLDIAAGPARMSWQNYPSLHRSIGLNWAK
jgi:hypothetical protein